MADRKYYCLCDLGCKFETMTKEQILVAIEQAVNEGKITNIDTGFVTKLKELNKGGYVTVWRGTTAEYNALTEKDENCIYIKTDDTRLENIEKAILKLREETNARFEDERENINTELEALDASKIPYEYVNLTDTDTDIDQLIEQGFYVGTSVLNSPGGVTNPPFTNFLLEVRRADLSYINNAGRPKENTWFIQKAYDLDTGVMAIRKRTPSPSRFMGIEWEYENPNVIWQAGAGRATVLKTTERFMDKPVYTTVIKITDFEDGKEVNISTDDVQSTGIYGTVLRYSGYLHDSTGVRTKTLPYLCSLKDAGVISAWLTFKTWDQESRKILMQMHGDNAATDTEGNIVCKDGWVQIWFIREAN